MGMTDRFELPVTAASATTLADYVTAVDLLLFEDTLIVALLRSGRPAKAAASLRARLRSRPSQRDRDWLGRCSV
jgi:hypothetical protein